MLDSPAVLSTSLFSIAIGSAAISEFAKVLSVEQGEGSGFVFLDNWDPKLDSYMAKTEAELE